MKERFDYLVPSQKLNAPFNYELMAIAIFEFQRI